VTVFNPSEFHLLLIAFWLSLVLLLVVRDRLDKEHKTRWEDYYRREAYLKGEKQQ
jgi:hypothetical protein